MIGPGMRVIAWIEVLRPRIPPTSSWCTDLVRALVEIVLLTASPYDSAGMSTMSTVRFVTKPHRVRAIAATESETTSSPLSVQRLVSRPMRNACTNTERTPT